MRRNYRRSVLRSTFERPDERARELRKVRRSARGDQIPVHDHGAVLPQDARVLHVILDRADAGCPFSFENARRDRYPACMTDERYGLSGLVDLARQRQHFLETPQLVRREAPGNHQSVEISCLHLIDLRVDRDGVPAFAGIGFVPDSRDHGRHALLLEANLGIPQLEVFIQWTSEEQHLLSIQRHTASARPIAGPSRSAPWGQSTWISAASRRPRPPPRIPAPLWWDSGARQAPRLPAAPAGVLPAHRVHNARSASRYSRRGSPSRPTTRCAPHRDPVPPRSARGSAHGRGLRRDATTAR